MRKSLRGIEQRANDVLADAHIVEPPIDVERVAEALGAVIRAVPGDPDVSGMLYRHEGRTLIGVNASHHPNRQRFTIAHECGHLCLHKSSVYVDAAEPLIHWRDGVSALGTHEEEIEANNFAACLLIPRAFLAEDISRSLISSVDLARGDAIAIKKLARRYRVSPQAMTHRLVNLGFVSALSLEEESNR